LVLIENTAEAKRPRGASKESVQQAVYYAAVTSFDSSKGGRLNASAHLVRGIGLQLFVRRVTDIVVVDLRGKATIGLANDLLDNQLQQLIDEGNDKILLNLSDVTQMDSSSISSIIRAFQSLQRRGANLRLLRPQGNVRLVLETVHLLDVVPTIEDETQAIASFR
jgi:anti-sigma B factor antagonist